MTTGRWIALAGVAFAATHVLRAQTAPRAPQTFRTSTDVVAVDVSVRSSDQNVAGLTAADFVLTDNGVRQAIESVERAEVPVDVTLVVDLSGNLRRPWIDRIDPRAVAAALEEEVRVVTRLLRPTDRVRLLASDRYIQQVWPFTPVAEIGPVAPIESDGLPATYDALAAALLHPVEPARRHVVIARTKGIDSLGAISASTLRAVVEQSDALFHLVLMETAVTSDHLLTRFQCGMMDLCSPIARFWVPGRRELFQRVEIDGIWVTRITPEGLMVKGAIERAGGGWHQSAGLSEPSLTGTFRAAFENFRTSYVLRYSPRGVTREGWHDIEVTVPRYRGYTVRARNGYGIDTLAPAPPLPPAVPDPRTLPELITAYERRAFQAVAASLRRMPDTAALIRQFEAAGNPWPAAPHREAALALELAEPSVFSARAADREQAHRLLARFANLILDPLEPSVFERYWHFAAIAQLQGSLQPAAAATMVERALASFPDEPQFLLARAIAADQSSVARTRGQAAASVTEEARVRQYYEAAIAATEVTVEARIRLAWYLNRTGHGPEAAALLDDAAPLTTTDPTVRYWRELLTGLVRQSLGETERAVRAFRAALGIEPAAQSARVALMNTLVQRGDRAEAEALAEQVQAAPAGRVQDPWWTYWQGQYRFYPQVMARVRELAR